MHYTEVRVILDEEKPDENGYSFERTKTHVSVIRSQDDQLFLRVCKQDCAAEGNGRPVTTIRDHAYPINGEDNINEANWLDYTKSHFSDRIVLQLSSYEGCLEN